jgi:hypothetical protein
MCNKALRKVIVKYITILTIMEDGIGIWGVSSYPLGETWTFKEKNDRKNCSFGK